MHAWGRARRKPAGPLNLVRLALILARLWGLTSAKWMMPAGRRPKRKPLGAARPIARPVDVGRRDRAGRTRVPMHALPWVLVALAVVGAATLFVTPAGESLLIDSGYPDNNGRDRDRILKVVKEVAGRTQIDNAAVTQRSKDRLRAIGLDAWLA